MPYVIRAERLALVLCGGREAPDAGFLAQTRERAQAAGFELLPAGISNQTENADNGAEPVDLGPLGCILAAVQSCADLNGSCLLVVPADMPNVNPRALNRLADIAETDGRGAVFDLGPLPLALILTPRLHQTLRDALEDSGRRSLTGLVERLGLPIVASLPEDGLDNLVSRRAPVDLSRVRKPRP